MSGPTDPPVQLLLDNHRVLVERHVLGPGQSTGAHTQADPQLWVCIHGGPLAAGNAAATLWADGDVTWFPSDGLPAGSHTNAGSSDIQFVRVTLKPVAPDAPTPDPAVTPLVYPNVPGEVVLDNEWVIAQRFVFQPGQWEGVHAHQPNTLFVHVRGGHWGERTYTQPLSAYPEPSPDGSVGWMKPVGLDVGHESCNIGDTPIDLVWVSLKR